jgi:hypothetical protein
LMVGRLTVAAAFLRTSPSRTAMSSMERHTV